MKNVINDKHIIVAMIATLAAMLASVPCVVIFLLSRM